ncbi:MAG TPA: TatD family hydrolase [Bacillota bacterium]|nr:TatD family hydrolase [Bacillota bacterium]
MFFDTHAHLDDKRFDKDREQLISGLPARDIANVVNVGADMESSRRSIGLAESYDFIYASVGVHPHAAAGMDDTDLDQLAILAIEPKVVAIGEIGLDYYYDNSPRLVQKERFAHQLELSGRVGLPVIIHNREAHKDTLDILRAHRSILKGGVMHCYSGSWEMAKDFIDLGFYIALGGPVTFKNAKKPPELAANLPIEHLLIETDCPYLTPHPFRGKRNDPGLIRHIADRISEIRHMDLSEIARVTKKNACRLFNIPGK